MLVLLSFSLLITYPQSQLSFTTKFERVIFSRKLFYSVGIDLGTTFSLVSLILPAQGDEVEVKGQPNKRRMPIVIPVDSLRMMPSVVSYSIRKGKLIPKVGIEVFEGSPSKDVEVYTSVKRIIGRNVKEVKELISLSRSSYSISSKGTEMNILSKVDQTQSLETPCRLLCPALEAKGSISPEEVSAEILRKLLSTARDYIALKTKKSKESVLIDNAVITVPAYFSNSQRNATIRAGEMAGLKKVKLLKEPEAAALAYGLLQRQPQLVLVFDLGGGTFDVSVLEVGGGLVEVIATSGDGFLGGDDFDTAIVVWIQKCLFETDPDLAKKIERDPAMQAIIREAAVRAKIQLSSEMAVNISIPILSDGKNFTVELTRFKFQSLCKDLISRLLKPLREVALMAGVNLPGESGQLGVASDLSLDEEDDDTMENFLDKELSGGNSIRARKEFELAGKANARARNKAKGKSNKELRKLQREYSDPSLALFPGGRELDDVILVGGATRMPCILRLVRTITGVEPRRSVNPDEAVCQGAGIWAGILDGIIDDVQVMSSFQAAIFRTMLIERQKGPLQLESSNDEAGDEEAEEEENQEEEINKQGNSQTSVGSVRQGIFRRLRSKKQKQK